VKSERLVVASGFILISLIWGSTWLAIKIGLESVPPFFGVALRFTVAMIILAIIQWIRGHRLPSNRKSILCYLTVGVLSFSFPFALVYWGEQYVPSGLTAILFAVNPFIVALGSHLYLPGERSNVFKFGGIVVGFAGIGYIFWNDLSLDVAGVRGMGAILISTIMQGISLVTVKRIAQHLSPAELSLGGMLFGVPLLYILAFAFELPSSINLDLKGAGSILYLGLFGTVITFLTYYWLLKRVEAVYLSLVAFVTPVLAVILGSVVLNERLESHVFSGAGLVLAGIVIVNSKDLYLALMDRKKRMR
jgi:drug/metabolite transporter (DMT)-like permease